MQIFTNQIINEDVENILQENLDWSYFAGKNVLITGANGFIPSYIVYSFLALNETIFKNNPCKIITIVRNQQKAMAKFQDFVAKQKMQLVVQDICEEILLEQKIDIIIHAASQASPKFYDVDPVGTLKANTIGTYNLLELARKSKTQKFLFVSSGDVYGVLDGSIPEIDETYTGNVDITNVRSCYGESKRMAETMCVCYAHQFGFHVNMLRLAHTYGPGVELNDGRVFADFVANVLRGENILIRSDGTACRPFMYITDMIRAFFYVLLDGTNGNAYNICAKETTSIKELAQLICSLYPEKNLSVSYTQAQTKGYVRSASTGGLLSTEKLQKLGWKQNIDIKTGFKRMIESYKNDNQNNGGY